MTVSASLSPTPLLANETNQRNSLYLKINYRIPSFRLEHQKPRWRYYSVTALPLEIKETSGWWRRHSSLPHLISTNPITPNHRSDIMDRFSSFASGATLLSAAKWSAATTATENHIHCWVVAATFLTPPLDFYQINHTEPLLRHHGLIYDIRFWPDAANSSEMSRCRHTEHERRTWFLKFGEVLAGVATISD